MKIYIFMTSVALAAGVSLGYWTGQGSAETEFAQGCSDMGIVVVYDHQSEAHRHFHCFELDEELRSAPKRKSKVENFVTL